VDIHIMYLLIGDVLGTC